MISNVLVASGVGLTTIIMIALVGFYQTGTSPLVSPLVTMLSSAEPTATPEQATVSPSLSPTPTPSVEGVTTKQPSPSPVPTPLTVPSSDIKISFVNLPEQVTAGEKFIVQWRVDGPSSLKGEETTLEVSYKTGSAHSSSSSNTKQSQGSFIGPKTFDTTLSFGSEPATIHLTASALVNGKTITVADSIQLVK
jgi:hypothetical protein